MSLSYAETDTSFAMSGAPVAAAAKEMGNLAGGTLAGTPLVCAPLTPAGFDSYMKKYLVKSIKLANTTHTAWFFTTGCCSGEASRVGGSLAESLRKCAGA